MEVSVPSEFRQFIEQQVTTGAYATPSEVIGDALRLLRLHERQRDELVGELRRMIAVGVEQLDRGESVGSAGVFAELRQRNAAARAKPRG